MSHILDVKLCFIFVSALELEISILSFLSETDEQEADKSKRQREYLLSQVRLPTRETILRYPVEIWISSGKSFVPPEGNAIEPHHEKTCLYSQRKWVEA